MQKKSNCVLVRDQIKDEFWIRIENIDRIYKENSKTQKSYMKYKFYVSSYNFVIIFSKFSIDETTFILFS